MYRIRPFQEIFFICRVGLAMMSQCTKFEVSRFTRYDAMNGGAKCRKWGSLGDNFIEHRRITWGGPRAPGPMAFGMSLPRIVHGLG